jgi:O-methyltransferase
LDNGLRAALPDHRSAPGLVEILRGAFRRTPLGKIRSEGNLRMLFPEASESDLKILMTCKPYTMTARERLWALIQAVRYIQSRDVPGDFVECGVWRGGSSMAAAMAFMALGCACRGFWLYDTFEGMNKPAVHDFKIGTGESAIVKWLATRTGVDRSSWCCASIEDVRANLGLTGYPAARLRLVKGKVEQTLREPANLPDRIAVLRLDTDWYESTKVELEVLFDRLSAGGVLIIDDYGWWAGVKKAVDEFLAGRPGYLMNRIDSQSRMLIKV